jgi:hypothetical protein
MDDRISFYASFSYAALKILYGYWGFYTISILGPMIKATRVWGGVSSQGKLSVLDGGRGLVELFSEH